MKTKYVILTNDLDPLYYVGVTRSFSPLWSEHQIDAYRLENLDDTNNLLDEIGRITERTLTYETLNDPNTN